MNLRSTRRADTQRGQALTEFLVIAAALIPLFLLFPLIAKYQDISHSTLMASRYAAFDAFARNGAVGTWKSEAQLTDEVRRRFFSNPDAPVKTNDIAGNFLANQNLFWRGAGTEPLIANFADVQVSFGPRNSTLRAGAFTPGSDGIPFVLRNELALAAKGIYTANVSVKLANLPADLKFYKPFDIINLSIDRTTGVVIDGWAAKDPAQIEARIAASPSIFPVGPLAAVSPLVGGGVLAIEWPGALVGPKLGRLDFWRDVVPDDRLKSRQ